jgi:CHASE2 domain-containing sensor protein
MRGKKAFSIEGAAGQSNYHNSTDISTNPKMRGVKIHAQSVLSASVSKKKPHFEQ